MWKCVEPFGGDQDAAQAAEVTLASQSIPAAPVQFIKKENVLLAAWRLESQDHRARRPGGRGGPPLACLSPVAVPQCGRGAGRLPRRLPLRPSSLCHLVTAQSPPRVTVRMDFLTFRPWPVMVTKKTAQKQNPGSRDADANSLQTATCWVTTRPCPGGPMSPSALGCPGWGLIQTRSSQAASASYKSASGRVFGNCGFSCGPGTSLTGGSCRI